jgi:mono/diheme cytochrome c family protein
MAGAANAGTPQTDYMIHCMGCHLVDGQGAPAAGVPSFVDRVGYYLVVPDGRPYLAQVPGAADSPLDDAELAAVLNWILARFGGTSLPADYVPLDAAEVSRYRSSRPQDIDAERRRLAPAIAARMGS